MESTSISVHMVITWQQSQKSCQPCLKLGSMSYYLTMTILHMAGAAAVLAPNVNNKRLPNHLTIFTEEARAIFLALKMAQHCSTTPFVNF
jgi:hypothetical protein